MNKSDRGHVELSKIIFHGTPTSRILGFTIIELTNRMGTVSIGKDLV